MISTSKYLSVRFTPIITKKENSVCKFSNILPIILDSNENWRAGLKKLPYLSNIKTFPMDFFRISNDILNNDFSILENVLFVIAKRNCRVLFLENIAKIFNNIVSVNYNLQNYSIEVIVHRISRFKWVKNKLDYF